MKVQFVRPNSLLGLMILALNALPLVGIALWDWQAFDVIILYWIENILIGATTVLQMFLQRYPQRSYFVGVLLFAAFFCAHYGFFCWAHGNFLVSSFGDADTNIVDYINTSLYDPSFVAAVAALFVLQLFTLARHFSSTEDRQGVVMLMISPYKRIAVLHMTIIFGGFLISIFPASIVGPLVLIAIKMLFDLHNFGPGVLNPQFLERIFAKQFEVVYATPKIAINGSTTTYRNFTELKDGDATAQLRNSLDIFCGPRTVALFDQFIDRKVAEEGA